METTARRGSAAAGTGATGCFKCGLPGHWSRDCPSSSSSLSPNSNPNLPKPPPFHTTSNGVAAGLKPSGVASKPKKVPRTRPKLTPSLLLSDQGLGYVLRHFPRSLKFRGRGHEVTDLGNLIGLYSQWHSQLFPYYSFEQFVHKVEKLGGTNHVRTCIRELRNRVDAGGDPTKLHEPPVDEHDEKANESEEANDLEIPSFDNGDLPLETNGVGGMHEEELVDEIYNAVTDEPCQSLQIQKTANQGFSDQNTINESTNQVPDNAKSCLSEAQLSEEQRMRMEASRLKALERAAARAGMSQAG